MLEKFTSIVSEGQDLTEAQAEQSLELILSQETPAASGTTAIPSISISASSRKKLETSNRAMAG